MEKQNKGIKDHEQLDSNRTIPQMMPQSYINKKQNNGERLILPGIQDSEVLKIATLREEASPMKAGDGPNGESNWSPEPLMLIENVDDSFMKDGATNPNEEEKKDDPFSNMASSWTDHQAHMLIKQSNSVLNEQQPGDNFFSNQGPQPKRSTQTAAQSKLKL